MRQVDSPDSLENVETKWVGEIAENCPGVKLVLVALKCDLREQTDADDEEGQQGEKPALINYDQGLKVAEKIRALRYLGTWCALRQQFGLIIQAHFLFWLSSFTEAWTRERLLTT